MHRSLAALLLSILPSPACDRPSSGYDGPTCADAWAEAEECESYFPADLRDPDICAGRDGLIAACEVETGMGDGEAFDACVEAGTTDECAAARMARELTGACVESRRDAVMGVDQWETCRGDRECIDALASEQDAASNAVNSACLFLDASHPVYVEFGCEDARARCGT